MRLLEVEVDHFRNIINSSTVKIQEGITCLVGKNESGKTAFLHALYRLRPVRQNAKFSIADHYPAWLEKRDRLRGKVLEAVQPIRATFLVEAEELEELEQTFGKDVLTSNKLILSLSYGGTLHYDLQVNEQAIVGYFLLDASLPPKLLVEVRKAESISELLDCIQKIQTRENVSAEVKNSLSKVQERTSRVVNEKGVKYSIWKILEKHVPSLFYFDKYSSLPYSVDIKRLLQSDETVLEDGELTARSLLRLAAADNQYLMNPDYERRKRELENVANALTEDVLKYWSQNTALRVLPDITQRTISTPQGQQSVLDEIKFRIWDERHLLSLPINEHSSGFQWFFSFLAAFSEFEYRETPVVILLDEPALGLHAKAQNDFLRFIEERLAPQCQVIYTTHSPFMVQPGHLERVRVVEDKGREEGTKVSQDVMSTDPDTLFPLQGALGYDIAQHLFIAPHNLVVEGTSDFTYLTVISDYLRTLPGRVCLDEQWSIVPVGGAEMIPTFVALLGNHLDVTVLVDSQGNSHQRLSNLAAAGYLAQSRIVTINEITGSRLADIEDLFQVADYLRIYNSAFSETINESDLHGTDPIVSRIARHKSIKRFDHGKPADTLLRERDLLLPNMSQTTLVNFEKLFERLNLTLGSRK